MCFRGQNLISRINNFPMGHCTIGESLFCLMIQRIDANSYVIFSCKCDFNGCTFEFI